ncbi:MAG: YidC/Oxa1 family membrane protein insertase, partial [Hyphomicrobiales bacterium]
MDQKNVWIAMAIILAMFFGYQIFYELPRAQKEQAQLETQQQAGQTGTATGTATTSGDEVLPGIGGTTGDGAATLPAVTTPEPQNMVSRADALAESPRIRISSHSLDGSISLRGARLDDLSLVKYRETVDPTSPEVVLLSPVGGPDAYYAEFGWLAKEGNVNLPNKDTLWQADDEPLTPDSPLVLTWDNGAGLIFTRTFSIGDNYMFPVTQSAANNTDQP